MREKPTVWIEDEDSERLVALPYTMEVCDRCGGEGSHVNPAVDGNGITADEWWNEWGEDEREGYLNGRYDVACEECGGKNVVPVLDEDRCDPDLLAEYRATEQARYEMAEMSRMERMMGC